MDIVVKTYNAHALNTGNYRSVISSSSPLFGKASFTEIERADFWPIRGGKQYSGNVLLIDITVVAGTIGSGLDELGKWFNEEDSSDYVFVIQDANNGNKEWYLDMSVLGIMEYQGNVVTVALHTSDPIWKSVVAGNNSWGITATAQTRDLTILGNRAARPVFTITPTVARGSGYFYRRFVAIANRTTRVYRDALNLPDSDWDTAAMVGFTGISNQINVGGGINASVTTWAIDTAVGGGLPASGTFKVDNEQCSYTGKTASNIGTVVRGINGTTAAVHADNAVMRFSKAQADGDDLRIANDKNGREEYRWFGGGGFNTTTTRVFSNVSLQPQIKMTTSASISSAGAVSSIVLANTAANRNALRRLKLQTYPYIGIDMGMGTVEIFKFTRSSIDVNTLTIGGTTRAQKGTSNQAHSAGATIRHIVGYYIMYGNTSVSAPSTDDGFKPMIDMVNSTNASHVWADFYDALNPGRSCQWIPQVILNTGRLSEYYTATQDTFADVASVIGVAVKVYTTGGVVRAPNAKIAWSLYHPGGMTTLTWSGLKYRFATSWPFLTAMQKSNDGETWSIVADEATPASAGVWGALTAHSGVALGATYLHIRNYIQGTLLRSADNMAAIEISDLTAALDTNANPVFYFASEEANNYMDFRLTNNTTGQWLEVSITLPVGESITIDTENLEAYTSQGVPVPVRLDDESRTDWLPLGMNTTGDFTGAAQLKYDETGVNGVTLVTDWVNRNL